MSKIRSFIGEPTIADLHFSICPLHTASETPLNRKCIYYFGKGLQVIGQFQVQPSGGESLQNSIDSLANKISFRVQSDKFAQYIWSVYDVVEAEEGEIQDMLEEVKINIKPFWDNYQEKKIKIQQGTVNFANSKIKLAYLFCITQESKIEQQIIKYLRKSKGLRSQPSINQQKKQIEGLSGLQVQETPIQQIPSNATQSQNQQQVHQNQVLQNQQQVPTQVEAHEAEFVIRPIQTQNIQVQEVKQNADFEAKLQQQHQQTPINNADEQQNKNKQGEIQQQDIFSNFIMPIIRIHEVFDPEDDLIQESPPQAKQQIQQYKEQTQQQTSSPVKLLSKDNQDAQKQVAEIPIQNVIQEEKPSNQQSGAESDFIASNPLQFLLGPLKKVFPQDISTQQQAETAQIKNLKEQQKIQVEECEEVRLQELQSEITHQNQQETVKEVNPHQIISQNQQTSQVIEQNKKKEENPPKPQIIHKTPVKHAEHIPTIDLSKLKRQHQETQYSHSERKAADQVQKDVEQALSDNKGKSTISKVEADVQLFSQITQKQPSITLTKSSLYDAKGNKVHPGTQMTYKNIVLLAIVLIFSCFAGYFVNRMINTNLIKEIKEDKKQKPAISKKQKKSKKKPSKKQ